MRSGLGELVLGAMLVTVYHSVANRAVKIKKRRFSSEARSLRRQKRQTDGDDFQTPWRSPLPGRSGSAFAPTFPFAHTYQNGILIDPGNNDEISGFLNVPVPTWGLLDIKGNFDNVLGPVLFGYGHLLQPVNPLGLNGAALSKLSSDPQFLIARESAQNLPVADLPGDYRPLHCKPPFCNPFVSNIGVGVEFDEGQDPAIIADLDFPIPIGPNGLGVRFPLSGGIEFEGNNVAVNYGQQLGPVDALGAAEADLAARERAAQRTAVDDFLTASQNFGATDQGFLGSPGFVDARRPSFVDQSPDAIDFVSSGGHFPEIPVDVRRWRRSKK